jgi:hypothetical protein
MRGGVVRLLPCDLLLQPLDVLLRLGYTSLCARDFGIQVRYLQHGQRSALVHTIANIDIDMTDVTRNLAVHIDILKGLEDAGDGKLIRNRADVRCNHGDGWWRWRLISNSFMLMMRVEKNEYQNDCDQQTRHEDA